MGTDTVPVGEGKAEGKGEGWGEGSGAGLERQVPV